MKHSDYDFILNVKTIQYLQDNEIPLRPCNMMTYAYTTLVWLSGSTYLQIND